MLTGVADASRGVAPSLYERHLAIVLDGLRLRDGPPPTPLPVEALDVSDVAAVLRPR